MPVAFAVAMEFLAGALLNIAVTVAGRVLVGLGIGVVTVTGLTIILNYAKSQAVTYLQSIGTAGGSLGADILSLLAYMKVGVAISIIFSAWTMRLTIQGLSVGGSISRFAMKYWKG